MSHPRIMLYSHDTFGLGHIRRTRAIANALGAAHEDASILIVSGSRFAGSFQFHHGIDFVRVPGVTKREDGHYESASLRLSIDDTTALRASIIKHAAEAFRPHIFIADKEPVGFRGELMPTLDLLDKFGTHRIAGLRDVLDEAGIVRREWTQNGNIRALTHDYDEILVYGTQSFYAPLEGVFLPSTVLDRIRYTGYLRRTVPGGPALIRYPRSVRGPFILVTIGGGGDGDGLVDWVISAYEHDRKLPLPAVLVLGPYMSRTRRREVLDRADGLDDVDVISFDPKVERLMARASAVVAMGGYNTFCEILSFDKPALIVPRSFPRLEQTIRATRAAELGLLDVLADPAERDGGRRDPAVMAQALRALVSRPKPSSVAIPGLLDGLSNVVGAISPAIEARLAAKASMQGT